MGYGSILTSTGVLPKLGWFGGTVNCRWFDDAENFIFNRFEKILVLVILINWILIEIGKIGKKIDSVGGMVDNHFFLNFLIELTRSLNLLFGIIFVFVFNIMNVMPPVNAKLNIFLITEIFDQTR